MKNVNILKNAQSFNLQKTAQLFYLRKWVLFLFLLIGISTIAFSQKNRSINFRSDWNGLEGMEIKAGNDKVIVNFNAGSTAACAQELVDGVDGINNFTASRIGTIVTITHPTIRPRLCKVNIDNRRNCAAVGNSAEVASENLIQINGLAQGNGILLIGNQDIKVAVETVPGQTALELADLLVQQLDEITPDEPFFDFGVEFSVANFGQGPIGSVDIGINDLDGFDLFNTQFESTDPGITMNQEECSTNPLNSELSKAWKIQVSPNPFSDHIQLKIQSPQSTPISIQLLTIQGKSIYTNVQHVREGEQYIDIQLDSKIPPGIYLIELADKNNIIQRHKIIGN